MLPLGKGKEDKVVKAERGSRAAVAYRMTHLGQRPGKVLSGDTRLR